MTHKKASIRLTSRQICRPLAVVLFSLLALRLGAQTAVAPTATLPGHVLQALSGATRIPHTAQMDEEPITLTVMLNLTDPDGAKAVKQDFADPNSANYRGTISTTDFVSRFGPSQEAYDAVLAYLEDCGFSLAMGSVNRRTLTVRGTRAQAQEAFHVAIDDYQLGERAFHAVASDPALPQEIAQQVAGVFGLSNLAQMRPAFSPFPFEPSSIATAYNGVLTPSGKTNTGGLPPGLDGAGQTISLIEFDGIELSDVKHWLKFASLPSDLIDNIEIVPVNGGTTPSGCEQTQAQCGTTEAMVDIEGVMGIAPGAQIDVFEAPSGTDLAATVNAVASAVTSVSRQGTIVSVSWSECEGDISASDAINTDLLLSDLTAQGLTLFASSGDTGSTCTDPSGSYPNAISYPADSASAVAVGGTTPNVNAENGYVSESWWKNAGGFGVSQWIVGPVYQVPYGFPGRSVPDVSIEANPGIIVCQAQPDLSPDCGVDPSNPSDVWIIGGTSLSAPLWAGTWAITQQAVSNAGGSSRGYPLTAANGLLYTIPSAFHSASSMTGTGNNFAHVGLGSPDITKLVAKVVPPRIDSFTPDSGQAAGGTKVTIRGAGFVGVEKVKFGGVDGTNLTIDSDTKLTVETPQAPSERAEIEVKTPGGTAKDSPFLYIPEITSVKPGSGPMEGGASVTVTGRALATDETFVFGSAKAKGVSCSGTTSCTMTTPANPPGTVDVQAQTTWGDGSLITSGSHYEYDPLSISSFTPLIGPTAGGLMIQVYGHSFESGKTAFSFGGHLATDVVCPDPDYCYMNSPASSKVGPVKVTATIGKTTSAAAKDEFTFDVFPTVTGISPSTGAPGAVVTLTGTAFSTTAGQTTFSFFAIPVAGTCSSTTQCTAIVPDEVDGTARSTVVTVTVNGNTSLDSVGFSYGGKPVPPPCKGTACS